MPYPNEFLCDLLFDSDQGRMKEFFDKEFQSQEPEKHKEPVTSKKVERVKEMAESLAYLSTLAKDLESREVPMDSIKRIIEDIRRDILVRYRRE